MVALPVRCYYLATVSVGKWSLHCLVTEICRLVKWWRNTNQILLLPIVFVHKTRYVKGLDDVYHCIG